MNKKDFSAPFIIAGLSIVFVIICAAILFTKGKSEKWIARKMKIGALLLGLNVAVGNGCITRTCYVRVPDNRITIENSEQEIISLEIGKNDTIKGNKQGSASILSYMITDSTFANILIQENLAADDGTFDAFKENFSIAIPSNLKVGKYYFLIFTLPKEKQSKINYFNRYELYLKD
jgi:hypothetical protein